MYDSVLSGSPAIERVWVGDSIVEPGVGHRSDPVLGADLVFTIDDDTCAINVQGPVTTRTTYPHREGVHYVGVRFRPGVGLPVDGASIAELCDGALPVSSVVGLDLRPLAPRLLAAPGLADKGRIVNETVHRAAVCRHHRSPLVAAALGLFKDGPAPTRVRTVAEALGVSERELQRQFNDHLGIGPKQAARLVRIDQLQAAIDRRAASCDDLASLAVAAGFYDQSHMTNEVVRVLGVTPLGLLNERRAAG